MCLFFEAWIFYLFLIAIMRCTEELDIEDVLEGHGSWMPLRETFCSDHYSFIYLKKGK